MLMVNEPTMRNPRITVNAPEPMTAEAAVRLECERQGIGFAFVQATPIENRPDDRVAIVITSPLARRPFSTYEVEVVGATRCKGG